MPNRQVSMPYDIRYHHGNGHRCACEIVKILRVLPSGPLLQVCYWEIRHALLFFARFMGEIARLLQPSAQRAGKSLGLEVELQAECLIIAHKWHISRRLERYDLFLGHASDQFHRFTNLARR
jgi:hypothetical protein